MVHYCFFATPLGKMLACENDGFLTGLWFEGQKYYPELKCDWLRNEEAPLFLELKKELAQYFSGQLTEFHIPLNPEGTPFQKSVWKYLLEIPSGEIASYGDISKKVAAEKGLEKMSARAVGSAIGKNPISILVPCHRVLGANGKLTGYAGGIDRKEALLKLENAAY